jgi:hypothetical protein
MSLAAPPTPGAADATIGVRQSQRRFTLEAQEKPMPSPIVVGVVLRDDDGASLALAPMLARPTGAPLALVTSYAYRATAVVGGLRATRIDA